VIDVRFFFINTNNDNSLKFRLASFFLSSKWAADTDTGTDTDTDTDSDSDTDNDTGLDPGCTWEWSPLPPAPMGLLGTVRHGAVWLDGYGENRGKMLIMGGSPAVGGNGYMYDPVSEEWESTDGCQGGDDVQLVWSSDIGVLGWFSVGYFNPNSGACEAITPSGGSLGVAGFSAVWTGTQMIVRGGELNNGTTTNSGSSYTPGATNPHQGTWEPTSQGEGCPSRRQGHAAAWTGDRIVVWGGGSRIGGVYDPENDAWTPTTTDGDCPSGRGNVRNGIVWMDQSSLGGPENRLFVWGGVESDNTILDDGAMYDPQLNSWQAINNSDADVLEARIDHTAVWDDIRGEVIVWGGRNFDTGEHFNNGGHYNPTTDTWRPTATLNAPSPRAEQSAIWTGKEMIVWGGYLYEGASDVTYYADGAVYRCVPD
jgi:hypothetical protein